MKILYKKKFDPPKHSAAELPISIAVQLPGKQRTAFANAVAYIDPGANRLTIRNSWLYQVAEATWGERLPMTQDGVVNGPAAPTTRFLIRIGEWEERDFTKLVQVGESADVTKEVPAALVKRFKGCRLVPMGGDEDVLLGANFLARLLLVYDRETMTVIDPMTDEENAKHVARISSII